MGSMCIHSTMPYAEIWVIKGLGTLCLVQAVLAQHVRSLWRGFILMKESEDDGLGTICGRRLSASTRIVSSTNILIRIL